MNTEFNLPYVERASLVQIAVVIFLLTEELLYNQIANEKYNKLFTIFLFISGLALIVKSLWKKY